MKEKIKRGFGIFNNAFSIPGFLLTLLVFPIAFFIFLVPVNIHSQAFWITVFLACLVFMLVYWWESEQAYHDNLIVSDVSIILPVIVLVIFILAEIQGTPVFHAKAYASVLSVEEVEFDQDLPDAAGTDSIALMDTASAQMLGDREIGSLSGLVSQFDVSSDYSQIDYQGKPEKVAALKYAGFFKWLNNKNEGVPGYVTVDPVSMSASYQELEEEMVYVPSAYLLQDTARHIYLSYPTLLTCNLHFEIDEDGKPYYVASVYRRSIGLFGGKTISGCIILDPVTGNMDYYDLADVPEWVDIVYYGDIICRQYNWLGKYQSGFFNSLLGKKGCKRITTYSSGDDEEVDSETVSDYGYVTKDGDIWIYTGITSVNNDSSNIGFLLANERTGESHYFAVSGADEKSAMAAAEGEVQEKGYQASFPSLINVDGNPTYIMVLKDNSGLVKLYAAVNVAQYNLVTTASTQEECLSKYRELLGISPEVLPDGSDSETISNESSSGAVSDGENPDASQNVSADSEAAETGEADIVISEIRDIEIDGNTYLYLISDDGQIYKALVKTHEDMLLLKAGDTVHVTLNGNTILTCEKEL